jgi:RNA polymerase sigma factor (sigma-70 family)
MERVADLERSRAGSDADFAELLRPLIEPGFRFAFAMLHDASAAEDAVQEASFIAWRKLGRLKDRGRLRTWFLGVVANKCRNARRNRWTTGVSLGIPERVKVVSVEESTLGGADLRRAIARLRHDDRVVVALFFYLDMPLEEVAAATNRSVGATRARLYRSIKKLRPGVDLEEALR